MTKEEAVAEAQCRWPQSRLHNAYESIVSEWGVGGPVRVFNVVAYFPEIYGEGESYEAALEDVDTRLMEVKP